MKMLNILEIQFPWVKNSDRKIVVEEDRLMEVWRAHYDVLSNEEFSWDREGL